MLITKREAAVTLITGAIRAFQAGDQVCALTLAGAAEEALPRQEEGLFQLLKTVIGTMYGDEELIGRALNVQRNWLKHHNETDPDALEINGALVMIARAVSRLNTNYGREAETKEISDFLAPARLATDALTKNTA